MVASFFNLVVFGGICLLAGVGAVLLISLLTERSKREQELQRLRSEEQEREASLRKQAEEEVQAHIEGREVSE